MRVLRNVPHFSGSLGTPGIQTRDMSPASQQMWPMNKHPRGAGRGAGGGIINMKQVEGRPSMPPSPAPRAADARPEGADSDVLTPRLLARTLIRVDLAIL